MKIMILIIIIIYQHTTILKHYQGDAALNHWKQ